MALDLPTADVSALVDRLERRFPQTLVALPSGAQAAVRTAGDPRAPVVVLLHGIGSGAASWLGVADALSDSARVIAWDAPGYGASSSCAVFEAQAAHGNLHPNPLPRAGEGVGSPVGDDLHPSSRPRAEEGASSSAHAKEGAEAVDSLSRSRERAGVRAAPTAAESVDAEAIAYAERLGELLAALDIASCVLVGHSLGALIATAFACGPEAAKVRRLVLLSPARGYGASDRTDERAQVRAQRLGTLQTRGIPGISADAPGRMLSAGADDQARAWVRWNASRLDPAGYAQAVELLCHADITRAAGRLTMACEVHCGEHDAVTPPTGCREIATRLGASLDLIARAGHASPVERPAAVAGLVRAALVQVEPATATRASGAHGVADSARTARAAGSAAASVQEAVR